MISLISIYSKDSDTLIVEENGVEIERIDCCGKDVMFQLSDGTVLCARYSIRRKGKWSFDIEEEGYGENELREGEDSVSDVFDIDAELIDYDFID